MWNGAKPETEFQVYENNVRLWEFETEAEEKKRGVKLLWGLSGNARAVADTLEFEDVACEAGVKNITKLLREHLAPHLETSLPRAFEAAVYSLWTTGQQSSSKEEFQEYLIRMENNFNKLRKEGVSLPEQAEGYTIYRQAALFENPDMRVTIWTESRFERGVIVAALGKFDKVVKEPRKKAAFHQGCENYVYLQDGDSDQVFEEEEVMSATISRRRGGSTRLRTADFRLEDFTCKTDASLSGSEAFCVSQEMRQTPIRLRPGVSPLSGIIIQEPEQDMDMNKIIRKHSRKRAIKAWVIFVDKILLHGAWGLGRRMVAAQCDRLRRPTPRWLSRESH